MRPRVYRRLALPDGPLPTNSCGPQKCIQRNALALTLSRGGAGFDVFLSPIQETTTATISRRSCAGVRESAEESVALISSRSTRFTTFTGFRGDLIILEFSRTVSGGLDFAPSNQRLIECKENFV
jgi:hypothetical protein